MKIPDRPLRPEETVNIQEDHVESALIISPEQLANSKIIQSREYFANYCIEKGIRYLEIGVAWGYYSRVVAEGALPSVFHLMDNYDQDLKCWSWRKYGECKCTNQKHELLYLPETHQKYIDEAFAEYNVKTIKARAPYEVPQDTEYDFVYIDISNDRFEIRETLKMVKSIVPIGGYIGLNDYLIYDGIIEDSLYGTYQAVNEFLNMNKNWEVGYLALHPVGFYDIYLRRVS